MLKIDTTTLASLEAKAREAELLPRCSHCASEDTARVAGGLIGRTIAMAAATTRFKLFANGPKPGAFFCNSCGGYFG